MIEVPYEVTIKGSPHMGRQIFWAYKRSKAVHKAWLAAKDAGYKIPWTDFRAIRISFVEAL
jgi:hypothetical protein